MSKSRKSILSLLIALAASLVMVLPAYASDNLQTIDENSNIQNSSIILEGVENAIEAAENSQSGFAKDEKTGIIGSADGHALIPVDTVTNEGRIEDIEELRRRCGDDLILIGNKKQKIKFIGGKFSNVKVTDEQSAIKALDTLANLYDNKDGRRYLKLSAVGADSLGNPFYRFVSVDKETGGTNENYTVTLSVDTEGNVLGASNADSTSQWEEPIIKDLNATWGKEQDLYENSENGFTKLYPEARMIYDDDNKTYFWALYYEKDGIVHEVLVSTTTGDKVVLTKKYDSKTFHNNPTQSFNGDYEFKNLKEPTEKTFIDFYGNEVKLPVAYEEGKGWYIVDTDRNMICVESSENDNNSSNIHKKHYFSNEYFEAVSAYIKNETASTLLYNEMTLISAFTTLQQSYDESVLMGALPNPKTIYVDFVYDDYSDNASQTTYGDIITFKINNNYGNADFAGIAHEFGHAVVANHGQYIAYKGATGAINESYADIIGSLLKMIKKKEGKYAGNVNFAKWLIGEFLGDKTEHVIRNLSNPVENSHGYLPSPTQVNGEHFLEDTGVYKNGDDGNDLGGVHQNSSILSYICYRMYNEVFADKDEEGKAIPDAGKYRDLLSIWHDSVIYVNQDSAYADIKGYVLQAMKNHGYSKEMIRKSEQIFNDANVDDYKPFESNPSTDNVADQTDVAAAARIKGKAAGFDNLYYLVEGKANAENAKFDYEIAYDEYQLALLQGLSDAEIKEYRDKLEIAYNALLISNENVEILTGAFENSQTILKRMVDDKVAVVEAQEKVLKRVAEEKETNPNLLGAYRALRRSLKRNINDVDNVVDVIGEAAQEFNEFDEISDVFSDVWGIDEDDFSEYSDEIPEDVYELMMDYPENIDDESYWDYWDDFWAEYFETDYYDWYGNYQDWDYDYNYYDENYSDEDYFSDGYDDGGYDYSYSDSDSYSDSYSDSGSDDGGYEDAVG